MNYSIESLLHELEVLPPELLISKKVSILPLFFVDSSLIPRDCIEMNCLIPYCYFIMMIISSLLYKLPNNKIALYEEYKKKLLLPSLPNSTIHVMINSIMINQIELYS